MIACICGVCILLVFTYPRSADDRVTDEKPTKTVSIASFANSQEIEGHGGSFLSSGQIDEKTVLRYVEKHDDGTYTLEQVDKESVGRNGDGEAVNGTVVIQDAKKDTARIEWHTCHYEDKVADFLSADDCGTLIEIHVPKGTVSEDFSLDPAAD